MGLVDYTNKSLMAFALNKGLAQQDQKELDDLVESELNNAFERGHDDGYQSGLVDCESDGD
jgi:flagellar biosynthesis/type III secretory pathway protein FliH